MDMKNDYNNMFAEFPDLLSMQDLQDALKIGRNTAFRLVHGGEIKYMRIGRLIKIPKRFLIDFMLGACYNGGAATTDLSCHD